MVSQKRNNHARGDTIQSCTSKLPHAHRCSRLVLNLFVAPPPPRRNSYINLMSSIRRSSSFKPSWSKSFSL